MYYKMMYESPLGSMILAASDTALVGAWFEGQKYCYGSLQGEVMREEDTPILRKAARWLDDYFAGRMPAIMALSPQGTEFRRLVWYLLCQVPYGKTTTYGELAREVEARTGKKMSAQAIGGAVGHNPISIIIPCHRVLGAKGQVTGYAGGVDKKIALLRIEGVAVK
ncbi:methylated-DNA--[protein]-cysteine S-methyltransferase [uncultured Megasphaera sp.]|uniref:methylated-DNA--[protein]-cysteine S-methyltransferase n=1 Tax=uncultured Megasphaera sp. TaxID=165188 RepID=UPI0035A673F8